MFHQEARDSGVLVAVHVSLDNQLEAARACCVKRAVRSDRACDGRAGSSGRWEDFDLLKQPVPLGEKSEKKR